MNIRNSCISKLLHKDAAEPHILTDIRGIFCRGSKPCCRMLVAHSESKTDWMDFLTHNIISFVYKLVADQVDGEVVR